MNNKAIYIFEDATKKDAVLEIFSKFNLTNVDNLSDKRAFIDNAAQAGCGKILGCAEKFKISPADNNIAGILARREVEHLEKVEGLMEKGNYEKKRDKFEKKRLKLEKERYAAQDAAATISGLGNFSAGSSSAYDRIQQNAEKAMTDERVVSSTQKVDKFFEKKNLMRESQSYTTQATGNMGSAFVNSGAGFQPMGTNISDIIQQAKGSQNSPHLLAFEQYKSMIEALLRHSKTVSCMIVADGRTALDKTVVKTVPLDRLKLEDLIFLKNREMITITR